MSLSPEEWKFYTYALGYLTGRSGGDTSAQYLTTEPERWLAGYNHGKGDGVTHRMIDRSLVKRLRKDIPCRQVLGHGDSCGEGSLCSACRVRLEAADYFSPTIAKAEGK